MVSAVSIVDVACCWPGWSFYAPSGNAFSRWLLSAISNFRWERPAEGFSALFSQLVDASVFPAPLLLVGCCTCLGVFPRVGAMVGVVSVGDVACFGI